MNRPVAEKDGRLLVNKDLERHTCLQSEGATGNEMQEFAAHGSISGLQRSAQRQEFAAHGSISGLQRSAHQQREVARCQS
jgi:hypothetical protein